ncbi:PHD finger protein 20 [Echria macrotheca]|uniref:PHD finger protein 20 n=1 Tax=Echria macrotheca TaxID=438768 RepID=A0AAJ0B535_9PEZI|nr:PHD finger protein 20 [Echria macrotheca]
MSGDQPASSFGDHPNAQPPTPKQTPTSAIFPSPVFETPKNNQGRFDDSTGWTPRFAEEYSVFNATPGNLRASQARFPDFTPSTPFSIGSGHKRQLSAEGLAAEIASHVNHFSPNPLPPVDPSRQLKSSTSLLATPVADRFSHSDQEQGTSAQRSAKKARRGTVTEDPQGQTATPPPSSHKGGRKLAPKLDTNAMQNDQGYGQPDFMANAQQHGLGGFDLSGDMFSYPLSAPATAAAFGNQQTFWDPEMGSMDIDFSAARNDVVQTPNSANQPIAPADWARATQMMQEAGGAHMQNAPGSAVSQASMQALVTSVAEQAMFVSSFPAPMDDVFGIMPDGGAVNPGLLFSRPPSSSMDMSFSSSMQTSNVPAPMRPEGQTGPRPLAAKPTRGELRRSASEKDMAPRRQDRATASSPIKPTGRPGLSRSFSESRGKKPMNRTALPTLAPAPRPQSQILSGSGMMANRPVISQPNRPSGRSSPPKGQHQRLPSLSSIPETIGPRTRTQAKFTIDANGRARVETTVIVDEEPPPSVRKRHSAQPLRRHRSWNSSEDDDSSSEDDDPIIIPSRNTSFALPDPRKPTTIHPFHSSQRSVSERSTTSYTTFRGSQGDADSDTETIINDLTPRGGVSGDAASELRKLRESRRAPPELSSAKSRRFSAPHGGQGTAGFGYEDQNPMSPSTEATLPTPSTDSRTRGVRCVCNRPEIRLGGGFMVQCASCEMYLHGQCVNVTEQTMPSIYICAFCANTPNLRGGRIRDNGHVSGVMGPRGSPLARKSFKSFR